MNETKLSNEFVKEYYRDCHKGIEDGDWRIYWERIRGLPANIYQSKRIKDTIAELSTIDLGDKVLDAACGSGEILSSLPKGTVGIEINPWHLKRARKNASQAKIIEGDIEKIPYSSGWFDSVLIMEVFEHIPDARPILNETWRVLRKGGRLIISVPTKHWLWRWRFFASAMYVTEPQCLSFSRDEMLKLLDGFNYDVEDLKKIALGLNYLLVLKKR